MTMRHLSRRDFMHKRRRLAAEMGGKKRIKTVERAANVLQVEDDLEKEIRLDEYSPWSSMQSSD